jgi:hypothetical protein
VSDVRDSETWRAVEEHFTKALAPSFGTPYRGMDVAATSEGSRIAFTGMVYDRLEHGVESQFVIYPEEGDGVRAFPAQIDFCTRVLMWFDRHCDRDG